MPSLPHAQLSIAPLDEGCISYVLARVLGALAYLHGAGRLHRCVWLNYPPLPALPTTASTTHHCQHYQAYSLPLSLTRPHSHLHTLQRHQGCQWASTPVRRRQHECLRRQRLAERHARFQVSLNRYVPANRASRAVGRNFLWLDAVTFTHTAH